MSEGPSILVVDNYDSFVYNLVQYLGELGALVTVRRNDEVTTSDLAVASFDGVLISPGPGYPSTAGNCLAIIGHCADVGLPLLGVCLGHQALAEAFGGKVLVAPELLHGRASLVTHDGEGVFRGVANPLVVGRYHSLVAVDQDLPDELEVSARSNGLIMGLRHRSLDLEGVQFHPESVLTQDGYLILGNWLERCGARGAVVRAKELGPRADDVRAALPQPRR
ncbi:MAG TPA: gamma-glutamyl-gamma-aminobutyrate hydrolase family protein [Acidimicrobiales bacterium]|nr:gamma-glutamyl-gamma-aminobutyrate hydrolase family protein [Acidimicrobiales bacterium]